jgi:hypothetical protein
MGDEAINAPELASFFVEKPAFLLGCFDDAICKKRTVVLIRGRTGTEPVNEIATHVTLDSKQYSQHF